jgi:hypothetical protein
MLLGAGPALASVLFFSSPGTAQLAPPAPASGAAPAPPPAPASASVPHPYAYGILVGTNSGGAGQAELRYAEDDAKRVAQVLRELGRFGPTDMRVLLRPDGARVLAAVDDVAVKLRAHQARGEQAVFVFYYSGHAKANAFSLGSDELMIATLREKLRQLLTTLTLVILDACQSGQFARIKGAEPASDFSFNSVSRLTTKGIAVMASSSEQELSQESDELHSSYFTHHLLVALRGAADVDGDGRVSLDEAYRYAYRNTLVSTAQTQVGSQHVTLETNLAGQGDVPVTYPADGRAQLELPDSLDARVLVQHKPSGNIVAEVQKAPGRPVRLAFAAGSYEAVVRRTGTTAFRCSVSLSDARVTALTLDGCQSTKLVGIAKGEEGGAGPTFDAPPEAVATPRSRLSPWQIEAGIGILGRRGEDAFTRRLNGFGYSRPKDFFDAPSPRWRFHAGASKGILSHVSVGAFFHTLGGDRFERHLSDSEDAFSWDTYGLSAFVRGSIVPVGQMTKGSAFIELYAQGALGVSLGLTTLTTGSPRAPTQTKETSETYWGYVLGGQAGVAFAPRAPIAVFLQGGYEYAPTISNLLGDDFNSGGPSGQLGLRLRLQ